MDNQTTKAQRAVPLELASFVFFQVAFSLATALLQGSAVLGVFLKTAMTASPMNLSSTPPLECMALTKLPKYILSIFTICLGEWCSERVVNFLISENNMAA